jgi:hypothetical protein
LIGVDPRAERLQEMLDSIAAGETTAAALGETGADLELTVLAALGAALAETLPARPAPAFRARLQTELQREVAGRARGSGRGGTWWPVRPVLVARLGAVAVGLALALGSAVVASADSLPGNPLYPLKRAAEGTRIALASSPAHRAALYLDAARTRLWEVGQLVDRGITPSAGLIEDLIEAQRAAVANARGTDPALVAEADRDRSAAARSLEQLADAAPDQGGALLRSAARTLQAAGGGGPRPATVAPGPDAPVVPAQLPTVVPTPGVAATAGATETVVAPIEPTTAAQLPTGMPSATTPPPTALPPSQPVRPQRPTAAPPTDTPVPPTVTDAPVLPTPTLERDAQRGATRTAEARTPTPVPTPSREPSRRPPHDHGPGGMPGGGGLGVPVTPLPRMPGARATPAP